MDIAELIEFSEVSGIIGVSGKVMCHATVKLSWATVGVQDSFRDVYVQGMDGIDVACCCTRSKVAMVVKVWARESTKIYNLNASSSFRSHISVVGVGFDFLPEVIRSWDLYNLHRQIWVGNVHDDHAFGAAYQGVLFAVRASPSTHIRQGLTRECDAGAELHIGVLGKRKKV